MKQFFLLSFFVILAGTATLNAQCMRAPEGGGGCCSARSAAVAPTTTTPETVAATDATIEKQVDEASGETNYVRRTVNESTGEIIFTELTFDTESGAFVQTATSNCQQQKAATDTTGDQPRPACCQDKATTEPESGANSATPQPRRSSRVKLVRNNH